MAIPILVAKATKEYTTKADPLDCRYITAHGDESQQARLRVSLFRFPACGPLDVRAWPASAVDAGTGHGKSVARFRAGCPCGI